MKKVVLILAVAMTLSAAQSFAYDKDKKKCGTKDCCKKEAKAAVKKAPATAKKAA